MHKSTQALQWQSINAKVGQVHKQVGHSPRVNLVHPTLPFTNTSQYIKYLISFNIVSTKFVYFPSYHYLMT